ncbi:MAG TPA: hypothetical protein VFO86_07205 [Terriglobia bacterium]|nr:hypothetical protein [Terriglobia bacterium]
MNSLPAGRFALSAVIVVVVLTACIGGGVFYKETLTGKFAFWALDGLADNSLVEESPDRKSCTVLVGPTVFAAGFDKRFIIVARHPKTDTDIDRPQTEYFVISIADGIAHGPTSFESFSELRASLGVSQQLQFTKRIEQLAGNASTN